MEEAKRSETQPKGWPAALVMFHLGMWRERLHTTFSALAEGRDYARPPRDLNAFNDEELPHGIGLPLETAAARSDHLLGEIIDLYAKIGERPVEWNMSKTTTEAVLRSCYAHPRMHMSDYHRDNGSPERGRELFEEAAAELRAIDAPPMVLGAMLYNLALVRVAQGRPDEALELLGESFPMRPDLRAGAADDSALGDLREDSRFKQLLSS